MSTATQNAPQARDPRFASCLPAVLHDVGDYPCHATNVSRTGVQLFGDLPVPSVTTVRITLGAGSGDGALKATAQVVRVVGGEIPGEVVVGLEFAPLDDRRKAILDALLVSLNDREAEEATAAHPEAKAEPIVSSDPLPAPVEAPALVEAPPVHDEATLERIELARKAKPQERAKMFRDNDPYVLEGLALNPRLSKREIMTMVTNPQLLPSSIPILAAHPRARDDEELQMKLAAHPATPLDQALTIARALSSDGVRVLIEMAALDGNLRAHLRLEHPDATT